MHFISGVYKATVSPYSARAPFATLFPFNYLLREFPLSVVADCFELRCQPNVNDAIVLHNLSWLIHATFFGILREAYPGMENEC